MIQAGVVSWTKSDQWLRRRQMRELSRMTSFAGGFTRRVGQDTLVLESVLRAGPELSGISQSSSRESQGNFSRACQLTEPGIRPGWQVTRLRSDATHRGRQAEMPLR